jgi:hypothetical protein
MRGGTRRGIPMTVSIALQAWEASSEAGLPLRMAQRAFAALLDGGVRSDTGDHSEFLAAQLRSAARRTLSALSADEQSVLSRWLGLQLATATAHDVVGASSRLTRVDAMLAAGVAAVLPRTREELLMHVHEGAAAA